MPFYQVSIHLHTPIDFSFWQVQEIYGENCRFHVVIGKYCAINSMNLTKEKCQPSCETCPVFDVNFTEDRLWIIGHCRHKHHMRNAWMCVSSSRFEPMYEGINIFSVRHTLRCFACHFSSCYVACGETMCRSYIITRDMASFHAHCFLLVSFQHLTV